MNKIISSYDELQHEKVRLQGLLQLQKDQLRADVGLLKKQLQPANAVLQTLGLFTGSRRQEDGTPKQSGLLKLGLELGIDVLLRRTLFRKAGFVARMAMPVLMRNFSTNLVNGKGKGLANTLRSIFSRNKAT